MVLIQKNHSDKGLTLETSAFNLFTVANFTQNFVFNIPIDATPQFLYKLTPSLFTARTDRTGSRNRFLRRSGSC